MIGEATISIRSNFATGFEVESENAPPESQPVKSIDSGKNTIANRT
ncbi:hypothetical protein JCM19238_2840 [Vibrio ponticus]|nr:hypothetical protein JCM19238_2840 [Vibrio ponticus]